MATFRASHPVYRDALMAEGFRPYGEGRMAAPIGLTSREAKSLAHRVFRGCAEAVFVGRDDLSFGSHFATIPTFGDPGLRAVAMRCLFTGETGMCH